MAEKEATVYVVDVGASMGECHGGRTESDIDWAMRYVWDRITSTVWCCCLESFEADGFTDARLGCNRSQNSHCWSHRPQDKRWVHECNHPPWLVNAELCLESDNEMWRKHQEDSYGHLSVLQGIGQ